MPPGACKPWKARVRSVPRAAVAPEPAGDFFGGSFFGSDDRVRAAATLYGAIQQRVPEKDDQRSVSDEILAARVAHPRSEQHDGGRCQGRSQRPVFSSEPGKLAPLAPYESESSRATSDRTGALPEYVSRQGYSEVPTSFSLSCPRCGGAEGAPKASDHPIGKRETLPREVVG